MMKRVPFLTALLGCLAVLIHVIDPYTPALQFDRAALLRGQIWRLITGHWTHFGADHLRWDVIAFLAFGSLVEIRSRRAWLTCVGVSAIVIALGVAWLQPQFSRYRGLSGIDSALFAFVACDLIAMGWRENERLSLWLGGLALIGFVSKSVYELTTGLTVFVANTDNFSSVPLAHLLGALCGALFGFRTGRTGRGADTFKASTSTG